MKDFLIYIVEDDPVFAQVLEYNLELNPDNKIKSFSSAKDLLDNLNDTVEVTVTYH